MVEIYLHFVPIEKTYNPFKIQRSSTMTTFITALFCKNV